MMITDEQAREYLDRDPEMARKLAVLDRIIKLGEERAAKKRAAQKAS